MTQPSDKGARLVVDASVVTKWYLNDEDHVFHATVIAREFADNRIRLLAPDHIRYETVNAILNASRRGRFDPLSAMNAVSGFLGLKIQTVSDDRLLIRAFESATRYGCAFYDALYLALADEAQCAFVHADRRLHSTLGGRFERELWIEDYVRSN